MTVSGFLNYDEALQYARQLYGEEDLMALLHHCRSVIISEHNLSLIGTHFSFEDYDKFYQQAFVPLEISDEQLLTIPADIQQPEEEEPEEDGEEGDEEDGGEDDEFGIGISAPVQQQSGTVDFDDDFF
jgi:hypothetical protein